jgi:hypothetical protein
MFDFVYDWLVDFMPRWLWWVFMVPIFAFLALALVVHFWPGIYAANGG